MLVIETDCAIHIADARLKCALPEHFGYISSVKIAIRFTVAWRNPPIQNMSAGSTDTKLSVLIPAFELLAPFSCSEYFTPKRYVTIELPITDMIVRTLNRRCLRA
jgi:hypothetical protein